jgi:hypothetical protein
MADFTSKLLLGRPGRVRSIIPTSERVPSPTVAGAAEQAGALLVVPERHRDPVLRAKLTQDVDFDPVATSSLVR